MENEIKEVMDEGLNNGLGETNRKASKGMILGIAAAAVTAVLLKFRKKISSKIESHMVKKLTKKGYSVATPEDLTSFSETIIENL